jgi:tRNA dimethylallyltransferase
LAQKGTLIVVAGPTAVGKTAFCVALAKHLQTEVLSADSRQFYKETRIGTAAPTAEEMQGVTHHFIGHLSVKDYYNVSMYERDAIAVCHKLFETKPYTILTGGSGLYLDAVCYGIDDLPDIDTALRERLNRQWEQEGIEPLLNQLLLLDETYYHSVDKKNPKRILRALEVCLQTGQTYTSLRTQPQKQRNFNILKICLTLPQQQLHERIHQRTDAMMENGFLQEAESLFPHRDLNALNTVGYKELFDYIMGKSTLDYAVSKIKIHTRRYAKRQMTWFKGKEDYLFFEPSQFEEILFKIKSCV